MMMKIVAATKTGLSPEPRDFFRHMNIPKKPEKEKAEAKRSDFFGLSPDYSLKGCVPVLPFSASSGNLKYSILTPCASFLTENLFKLQERIPIFLVDAAINGMRQ